MKVRGVYIWKVLRIVSGSYVPCTVVIAGISASWCLVIGFSGKSENRF